MHKPKTASLAVEITTIILLKLFALFGLWYFFINGHRVPHDTPATTNHLLQPLITNH